MKAFIVTIFGKVQGVGFRMNTLTKARELGLNGWVKNGEDGSVSCYCEGNEKELLEMKEWLEKGPIGSRVDKTIFEERNAIGMKGFGIR